MSILRPVAPPPRRTVRHRGLAALVAVVALSLTPGTTSPALATSAGSPTETLVVEGTHELVVEDVHGPSHDDGELHTASFLDVDGSLYELPDGAADGVEPGAQVRVTLEVAADTPVEEALDGLADPGAQVQELVRTGPAEPVDAAPSGSPATDGATGPDGSPADAAAAAAAGVHTLTVLPVFWTQPDGTTTAALRDLAAGAATYWSEQSAGRIAIETDVREWARIPAPEGCASARVFNDALAANPGVVAEGAAHVAVYFPENPYCAWAGLATVRGPAILLNGVPWPDIIAHEFGHNLGLGHANRAVCTADGRRVSLSATCTTEEYLDYADVMGIGLGGRPAGSLNSALADTLGLVDVRTAAATATVVDLAPLGTGRGLRSLRIPVELGELFVDFRPAVGRDVRYGSWAGVQVHLRRVDLRGIPTTELLDMQPGAGRFVSPQLPAVGWPVPGTGRTLRITALDATRARVELTDPATATPPAPQPGPATGAVVVTGSGSPVRDAVFQIRNASCGTVFSTMRTGADGTFPVTAFPGQYCLVPVAVPAPFEMPGHQVFTVGTASGFTVPVALTGPSSGSVVVTGGAGARVPGAVFEVRNASCSMVFSRMRTGADGTFPVTAFPGRYCLVGVSAPAPFQVPGPQVFTVGTDDGFSVPVALTGPSTGTVQVTGGGSPVAGAVFEVRNASCSMVFSRMRTGADGTFPVTAFPGQYCLVPAAVPAPFDAPGPRVFTVGPTGGFTVPVSLAGPSSGSVRATSGGTPVADVVVAIRNASCTTTFSTMRTGADGSFPVVAYPGTYCVVPVGVPAGFALPARQTVTVAPDQRFTVPLSLTRG